VNVEVLRNELAGRIDALLARPVLVWGRDRQLLAGLRVYVSTMTDVELERLASYVTSRAAENIAGPEGANP
jgi:hypothetical protein